jgi:hypothetical protein
MGDFRNASQLGFGLDYALKIVPDQYCVPSVDIYKIQLRLGNSTQQVWCHLHLGKNSI